jgi:hypothetical protein
VEAAPLRDRRFEQRAHDRRELLPLLLASQSTPLGWAREGQSRQSRDDPGVDWDETIRVLIEAGATDEID